MIENTVCNMIRHCGNDPRWESCWFSYDLSAVKRAFRPSLAGVYSNFLSAWTAYLSSYHEKWTSGNYLHIVDDAVWIVVGGAVALHLFTSLLLPS